MVTVVPAPGCDPELHPAAMRAHELPHDRQAEAAPRRAGPAAERPNARAASSGSRPAPLSVTLISTPSVAPLHRHPYRPPAGVARSALDTRLPITCRIRTGSTRASTAGASGAGTGAERVTPPSVAAGSNTAATSAASAPRLDRLEMEGELTRIGQ